MSSSQYETMLANKVHFSQWRDLIKGPEMRFHSAFDFELPAQQWTLVAMEKMRFPAELVLDFVEKQYVSVTDTNHQLLLQFALCESVRSAHRYLFSSLLKITNPGFPFEYPNQTTIGDVYFGGYWVRDNLFVFVRDLSPTPIPEKRVLELCAQIDAKLLEIPAEQNDITKDFPVIKTFSIQTNSIPISEIVPLSFSLHDNSYANDQLKLLFRVTGGKVSCKAGIYFYSAEILGKHFINMYVTNPAGKTSKVSIEVTVVQ